MASFITGVLFMQYYNLNYSQPFGAFLEIDRDHDRRPFWHSVYWVDWLINAINTFGSVSIGFSFIPGGDYGKRISKMVS